MVNSHQRAGVDWAEILLKNEFYKLSSRLSGGGVFDGVFLMSSQSIWHRDVTTLFMV